MTLTLLRPAPPLPHDAAVPQWATIRSVTPEAYGVATFELEPERPVAFAPGQYNVLHVPGAGDVAVPISSDPFDGATVAHTVRFREAVTRRISRLRAGDRIGYRGPFGNGWPLHELDACDVVVIAGGVGLASLRPAIRALLSTRESFRRLFLLVGATSPGDLVFAREYDEWRRRGAEVQVAVEEPERGWNGAVGRLPALLDRLRLDGPSTAVLAAGSEPAMRACGRELAARRVAPERMWLSLDRRMKCGASSCDCRVGPWLVCKDGPVFRWAHVEPLLETEGV